MSATREQELRPAVLPELEGRRCGPPADVTQASWRQPLATFLATLTRKRRPRAAHPTLRLRYRFSRNAGGGSPSRAINSVERVIQPARWSRADVHGLPDGGLRLRSRRLNNVANFWGPGGAPLPGSTTWFRYRANVWSLTPSAEVRYP